MCQAVFMKNELLLWIVRTRGWVECLNRVVVCRNGVNASLSGVMMMVVLSRRSRAKNQPCWIADRQGDQSQGGKCYKCTDQCGDRCWWTSHSAPPLCHWWWLKYSFYYTSLFFTSYVHTHCQLMRWQHLLCTKPVVIVVVYTFKCHHSNDVCKWRFSISYSSESHNAYIIN